MPKYEREDFKMWNCRLPAPIIRRLKIEAATAGITLTEHVTKIFESWIERDK